MERIRRTGHYTADELALIHLLDNQAVNLDIEVPLSVTQEGMARALGRGRSSITKTMLRLEQEGLVARGRAHVPGIRVRRLAFRLTENGKKAGEALRASILREFIVVLLSDGSKHKVPLREVRRLMPPGTSLMDILKGVKGGVLDLRQPFRGRKGKPYLAFPSRPPLPSTFVGREAEMSAMDEWLKSGTPVLSMYGLPGIGKSVLVSRMLEDWQRRRAILYVAITPWATPESVVKPLAEFLASLGKRSLLGSLETRRPPSHHYVLKTLERDLKDLGTLIVFDDLQKASEKVRRLIAGIAYVHMGAGKNKVVLLSRVCPSPEFYSLRDVRISGKVKEFHLDGLQRGDAYSLLSRSAERVEAGLLYNIFRKTKGNPLMLLLAARNPSTAVKDMRRYVESEVYGPLPEGEKKMLALSWAHRYPVEPHSLLIEVGYGSLSSLEARGLIQETPDGCYLLHDMVREFLDEILSSNERRESHHAAAHYFLSMVPPNNLEALYHLVGASEFSAAISLCLDDEDWLLRTNRPGEAIGLLTRLTRVARPHEVARLQRILGMLHLFRGDHTPALQWLRRAAAASRKEELAEVEAWSLLGIAQTQRQRSRDGEALLALEECLPIVEKSENWRLRGEAFREHGLALHALGRVDEAISTLQQAIEEMKRVEDAAAQSHALVNLSSILEEKGMVEDAVKLNREALQLAKRSGNLGEIARAHISLGVGLYNARRYEEALREYQEGKVVAEAVEQPRLVAYSLQNSSAVKLMTGQIAEALRDVRKARRIFSDLEEWDEVGIGWLIEASAQSAVGEWPRSYSALRQATSLLRQNGTTYDYLRARVEAVRIFGSSGDIDNASVALRDVLLTANGDRWRSIFKETRSVLEDLGSLGDEIVLQAGVEPEVLEKIKATIEEYPGQHLVKASPAHSPRSD